jgi:acetoin utilization protein AcuB
MFFTALEARTMLISDIMKTNIISIPSSTSLLEARRIMDAHSIRRLPVIDDQELVGIVTKDDLDKLGSSQLPTYSFNELIYMRNRMTVEDVMHRDIVTVTRETTIEAAVALAQGKRVGSLLVTESGKVVGIVTTNDFFLGVLNPLLGIGLPGSRIVVIHCFSGSDIEKVIGALNSLNISITNLFVSEFPSTGKHDLIVHLDTPDATTALETIRNLGFTVMVRSR